MFFAGLFPAVSKVLVQGYRVLARRRLPSPGAFALRFTEIRVTVPPTHALTGLTSPTSVRASQAFSRTGLRVESPNLSTNSHDAETG